MDGVIGKEFFDFLKSVFTWKLEAPHNWHNAQSLLFQIARIAYRSDYMRSREDEDKDKISLLPPLGKIYPYVGMLSRCLERMSIEDQKRYSDPYLAFRSESLTWYQLSWALKLRLLLGGIFDTRFRYDALLVQAVQSMHGQGLIIRISQLLRIMGVMLLAQLQFAFYLLQTSLELSRIVTVRVLAFLTVPYLTYLTTFLSQSVQALYIVIAGLAVGDLAFISQKLNVIGKHFADWENFKGLANEQAKAGFCLSTLLSGKDLAYLAEMIASDYRAVQVLILTVLACSTAFMPAVPLLCLLNLILTASFSLPVLSFTNKYRLDRLIEIMILTPIFLVSILFLPSVLLPVLATSVLAFVALTNASLLAVNFVFSWQQTAFPRRFQEALQKGDNILKPEDFKYLPIRPAQEPGCLSGLLNRFGFCRSGYNVADDASVATASGAQTKVQHGCCVM